MAFQKSNSSYELATGLYGPVNHVGSALGRRPTTHKWMKLEIKITNKKRTKNKQTKKATKKKAVNFGHQ